MSNDGNICDPVSPSNTLFLGEEKQSKPHANCTTSNMQDCDDVLANIVGSTDELLPNMIINNDTSLAVDTALEDDSYGVTAQQSLTPHGTPCGINKASCSVIFPQHIRNRMSCPDQQG